AVCSNNVAGGEVLRLDRALPDELLDTRRDLRQVRTEHVEQRGCCHSGLRRGGSEVPAHVGAGKLVDPPGSESALADVRGELQSSGLALVRGVQLVDRLGHVMRFRKPAAIK